MNFYYQRWLKVVLVLFCFCPLFSAWSAEVSFFKIHVVDEEDGRGIPLVELKTTNEVLHVTDSQGWIAFYEPGMMNHEVFFHVFSHGYQIPRDGFGYEGVRLTPVEGGSAVIRMKRSNLAKRLYRITGQGIYRDSVLLQEKVPIKSPVMNGLVVGQDSCIAQIYKNKIYWFWGDTSRAAYPLGNFRTTGAVSLLPEDGGLQPEVGIDLEYFEAENGFVKSMFSWNKEGVVWIDGLVTVPNPSGKVILLTHYTRLKGLGEPLEHGIAVFNDEKQEFEKVKELSLDAQWQAPRYHPVGVQEADGEPYFYFPGWFCMTRVKANYEAILDPSQYEAYTCLEQGSVYQKDGSNIVMKNNRPLYEWKKNTEPVAGYQEREWVKAGLISQEDTHFLPVDVDHQNPVVIHGSSVRWNAYRNKWVLIGVQKMGDSFLGEVWYAESDHLTGPWRKAKKIITHKKYSFYNPVHHAFFDQQDGKIIYFEGTYTKTFSGNDVATPYYDYNQMMYSLDLSQPALQMD